MALQPGDWVRTKSGEVGKVVHSSRLTVFVAFAQPGKVDHIEAHLESQLTKIDRRADKSGEEFSNPTR
jgi:hypothetical protein